MIFENGHLRVEVIVILMFFSFMLSDSIYTNFVIYRTCYTILDYNQTECALLGGLNKDNKTEELERNVEPYADTILMTKSIIESCVTSMLCLFVGPWSDKFGRKPLIVTSLIGFIVALMTTLIFTFLPYVSPWYFIISSIPICLTGGAPIFLTGVLSHITDNTNQTNRGFRMGIFEAMIGLGILLGTTCSSYLFYATSYSAVFATGTSIIVLSLILVIYCVPETLENKETEGHLKQFFQTSNIKEMFDTTFKKRVNFNRMIILMSILMSSFYIFVINGDGALTFLYLRKKFNWSLRQYTLYSGASTVLWIVGTVFGIYILNKLLKIPETILMLTAFISLLNGHLLIGLATKDWHLYAANVIRSLGGILSPMCRSLVSKLVPSNEIAKIFSMILTAEFIVGIFGSPLYTLMYNKTIDTDPSIFCFFTAGVYGLEVILIIIVIIVQNIKPTDVNHYNQLENEESSNAEPVTY